MVALSPQFSELVLLASQVSPASSPPAGSALPVDPSSGAGVASCPTMSSASRLVSMWAHIVARGFSVAVAAYMATSTRPSTVGNSSIFAAWCAYLRIDPFTASVNPVADFVIHLFPVLGPIIAAH
jgi:hypothetical protein